MLKRQINIKSEVIGAVAERQRAERRGQGSILLSTLFTAPWTVTHRTVKNHFINCIPNRSDSYLQKHKSGQTDGHCFFTHNTSHRPWFSTMPLAFCLNLVIICTVLTACNQQKPEETNTPQKPNIILIMTDDQGYGDLGCHGNPVIQTPNMDKLYTESVRLTNFHVGTTCAPTRAGLMTGMNCNRVGVWHTIIGRSLLKEGEPTMADIARRNGYETAIFGKWHLGDNYPFRPQDRGFEEVLIHGGGGVGQTPDYWNNDYFDDTYFHNGKPEKFNGYCTDVWFENAMQFIENNQNQPFFCYIATNAPHSPFHVPDRFREMYEGNEKVPNANFYGMISNIDENLGKLEEKLQALNLTENTILIFMTDNGTSAGVNLDKEGFPVKGFNAGMRGKKGSPYEGGHRVPFFIRWPEGNLTGGKDIEEITAYTDVLPTLIELGGFDMPKNIEFDGKSLLPLFNNQNTNWPERVLITDTQRKENLEKWRNASIMTNRWRLMSGDELYDMESDPGQTTDVSQQYPEVVDSLKQSYENWWASVSQNAHTYERIIIGSEAENPVTLTCHDFHPTEDNYPAWNQNQVRLNQNNNGFWAVNVVQGGTYKITVQRWPKEAQAKLTENVPPGEPVEGGDAYPKGVAVPVTEVKIKVGNSEQSIPINPSDTSALFTIDLPAGDTRLQTWLMDENGNATGAYYVYVEKIE